MVPWWVIPITSWASVAIAFAAYAIVKVGADSEPPFDEGCTVVDEDGEVVG